MGKLQKELPSKPMQVQSVDDEGYKGKWITENGSHLFIRDVETIEQARERVDRQQPQDTKQQYVKMSAEALKKRQTINLSKSEWARYYAAIGEIQEGTLRERKVKGGRWVILNVNVESDGTRTPARLIIDNGSYVSPRIKTVLTFESDDKLYDILEIWGIL